MALCQSCVWNRSRISDYFCVVLLFSLISIVMETAGLSVPGASCTSLGFEDYSLFTNLSDEELIQIAIERSLSEDHNNTPSTDTRQTPCTPNPEVRQPSTPHLPSTSTQPSNEHDHSTNLALVRPSTRQDHIITIHYSTPNPPTTKHADRVEDPLLAAIKTGDDNKVSTLVNVPGCNLLSSKPRWLAIHEAAAYGQEACLRVLLTAQPGMLNKKTAGKQTALMIAVNNEHASCVHLLLERGADPEIVNEDRDTPLKKACEKSNKVLVAMLLSYGAAVNTRCIQGYTALHEAVRQNNVGICVMLVLTGVQISATSKYGMTPLSTAAQNGNLETLRYLLKHGADINRAADDGATPIYEACKHGHVSTVGLLLSLKADVNRSTNSGLLPIHVAVQNAHTSIVSLLIPVTSQSSITSSGISPLHIAAEHNCNNIMELLLEAGFDPNCQLSEERRKMYEDEHSTVLYLSVYNRNLEATEMLLEAGANPNLDLSKPLLVAIRRESMEMVSILLKYGADVNASISTQPSAFPSAVLLSMDHLPMLKLLLDHGCNARSCFHCAHGSKPHPTQTHSEEQRIWNRDAPWSHLQFCEAVSKPSISHLVGPLISLLLNYVSHVRLCSRLMEHLVSSPLWTDIKIRAVPPHPLMHLCRLRIRHLVGVGRLKLLRDLDLPSRLIKFLCYEVDCSSLEDLDTPMDYTTGQSKISAH